MDLRSYLRAVLKYWWIVLATIVLGVGAASAASLATVPRYASTVTFFINTPSDTIAGSAQGDTFGQKRVNSYVQLITTSSLTKLVAADLDNGMTADEIGATIGAKGDLNTVLLTATVTDTSSLRSMQIATSVATQFVSLVSRLESADSATPSTVKLEVVDGPKTTVGAVEPNWVRNLGIGTLIGLVLGIGLALLRDALNTSVRTAEDLQDATDSAVLAVVSFDDAAKASPLIVGDQRHSIRAEAFRQLRTNLQFTSAEMKTQVIVVSSSVSGEGKSTTATNLAITFADSGFKVLLIEGDLRRPRVADYLGLEGGVGLTNVLAGQVALSEVIQPWREGKLSVLASGSIPPNPSEMLGSKGMIDMVASLRSTYDYVVIDTPPLLPVTDAAIVSTYADGVLMVSRYGKTTKSQLALSTRALRAVDARVLGSVLNMTPVRGVGAYSNYGYEYEASETRARLDLTVPAVPTVQAVPTKTAVPTGTIPEPASAANRRDAARSAADSTT